MIVDNTSPIASDLSLEEIRVNASQNLSTVFSSDKQLNVARQEQLRETALSIFDRTFTITDILLSLALLVAAIGIYVALNAMRLNQPTSERVLTHIGISRWEVLRMNLWRSVGVGLVALMLAIPLGLGFAWVLCHVVNPRAFGWTIEMAVSFAVVMQPVLIALAAVLAAGALLPGRHERGHFDTARVG